ncbi:hypothetical protein LIER_39645 [Lithospermum erythrorhizon]|uniref:Uncharacterized protein n=1 Tax=Lithospermum erythrorhizon TaxID=34254 RepID=A0AAV3QHX7_LITER
MPGPTHLSPSVFGIGLNLHAHIPPPTGPAAKPHQPPRFSPFPKTGLLGPRPPNSSWQPTADQEAYSATTIAQAMHTLGLNPSDIDWYMDTRVTSHMTSDRGTLPSYFNVSHHHNILVGNGHSVLLVVMVMHSYPAPTHLNTLKMSFMFLK